MISEYLVAVWSHSPRWGNASVKYYECSTHDEAQTFSKREAEYLDTIGREYSINIYVNEEITRWQQFNALEKEDRWKV